jgi:hypothetical protein
VHIFIYHVSVVCFITCGAHLHDHIIELRGEAWAHKTSLTPPVSIRVPVPSQESERPCSCVLVVSSLSLSVIMELFR